MSEEEGEEPPDTLMVQGYKGEHHAEVEWEIIHVPGGTIKVPIQCHCFTPIVRTLNHPEIKGYALCIECNKPISYSRLGKMARSKAKKERLP